MMANVCINSFHNHASIACTHDGNRLQPVFALIHKSLLPDLLDYLHSGERKIDRWYQQHDFTRVDFSDTPEAFANINTDQDRGEPEGLLTAGMATRRNHEHHHQT